MSIDYFKELENIEQTWGRSIGDMLRKHINHWSNWKKYPRKTKKYMKKMGYWNLRKCPNINEGDITVHIARNFNVMDNLVTMPNEFYQKLRNEVLDFAPEVIFNES